MRLKKLLFKLCYTPLCSLPSAQAINRLRGWVAGRFMRTAGARLRIYDHVSIVNPQNILIGNDVVINPGCFLVASEAELVIGDDCLLAPRCFLETMNHRFSDPTLPIRLQGRAAAPIRLGRDVWLGYGVVVLPGTTIGDGAVAGAYTLINRDVPAMTVNVGNPVRQVGERGVDKA